SSSSTAETITLGQEVYNDAKAAIKQLADALSVGVEHVYGTLIRQQFIQAVTDSIIILLFLIIGSVSLYSGYYLWTKSDDEDERVFEFAQIAVPFLITIGAGATILFAGTFVCNINSIITGFLNPEYGALMDVLKII